jgi:hypothetical protein
MLTLFYASHPITADPFNDYQYKWIRAMTRSLESLTHADHSSWSVW